MKKIGKKISFLTKIMLVIGLLISNLSSLSVVFAYEVPDNVVITLEEDNLNIKYTEVLAEDVQKVRVDVYESYTYLDSIEDEIAPVEYELDATQIESAKAGELELTHPKTNFKEFDGTYKVVVEIYKLFEVLSEPVNELESIENLTPEVTEELIATGTFEKNITYKSGLKLNVYNGNDAKIGLSNGKYALTETDSVRVDAFILAGGFAPSDRFTFEDSEYSAEELLSIPFTTEYSFGGKLYGEYSETVTVEVEKVVEEEVLAVEETLEEDVVEITPSVVDNTVKYSTDIVVMYGKYSDNTDDLNDVLNSSQLDGTYLFDGGKNGTLYSFIDLTQEEVTAKSMLDLYNVLETFVSNSSVSYKLYKGNEDLIVKYNETYNTPVVASEEGEEVPEEETPVVVSLEDYLKEIAIDETVKLTLTSDDVTISYEVLTLGDLNNDSLINEDDVLSLIELVLDGETDNEKADINGDGKVDSKDVLTLREVIASKDWNASLTEIDAELEAELVTDLTEETELVSGDEFTVDYVVKVSTDTFSGFSGMLEYDKEALELVSMETLIDALGNHDEKTGKFFYLGEESFALPEVTEEETTPVDGEEVALVDETLEEDTTVNTLDYAVIRAVFRTLKSGSHTVSVKDIEYYNMNTYLNTSVSNVSTTVEVVMSDDNKLTYLEVAGVQIELVEDVFEYAITVENEVTLVDLKYVLSNVAASVTSTIYPEELAEGENEVVVTVTSESGITQDYKVVVTRKEAKKEETTTQVNYNDYRPNYNEPEEEPVIPTEPVEEPKEKKEGNASKIIIIILIVLVVGGLIYLIFKDDNDEDNKKVNKLKKDTSDFGDKPFKEIKPVKQAKVAKNSSSNNKNKSNTKKSNSNNKKKER